MSDRRFGFKLYVCPTRLADAGGTNRKEDRVLSERVHSSADGAAHVGRVGANLSAGAGSKLLDLILASLDDDKALDVVLIDLRGKSEMADHMIIASGRSSRHVSAIAEHLSDKIKAELDRRCRIEGRETADWVLLDCGDAVVHLFRPEVREFYQLEKMWAPEQATPPAAKS